MDETLEKEFPWGPVIAAVVVLGLVIAGIWVVQDQRQQKEKEATLVSMDQELVGDEKAVKDERQKLEAMTRDLEALRTKIQVGQVKDGKAAVEEFNKMAADQRAEREKFVQIADQYNKKVAKFRDLQK